MNNMPIATLKDGCRLAYDDYDFTDPWGQPEVVVLVHGFSKNRKFWYEWIPTLARHYRVINVDQRGHGESSAAPPDFEMSLDAFAQDLDEFMDVLGIPSAHFIMAEFSSAVAVEFAIRYADRIKKLVLPGFGYNYKDAPIDLEGWVKLLQQGGSSAWASQTNQYRLPADADPDLRRWYIEQQSRVPAELLMKVFRYGQKLDLTDKLADVVVPTLILGGTAAKQDTAESLQRANRVMPRSKLVLFEGMPFNVMTACPQACVAETMKFLETPDPCAAG